MNKSFCKELEFTTAINTIAALIASKIENNDGLDFVSSVLVQIADTLDTIISVRELGTANK